mmetsp:Transcript_34706/g.68297  ORF Transcript_34706/g.68297 Transcript_34706/m.68297 type:complete len:330 (+) Transcript_34706:175-1164(+)
MFFPSNCMLSSGSCRLGRIMKNPPSRPTRTRNPSRFSSSTSHPCSWNTCCMPTSIASRSAAISPNTFAAVAICPSRTGRRSSVTSSHSARSATVSRTLPSPLATCAVSRPMILTAVYVPSSIQPFSAMAQCPLVSMAMSASTPSSCSSLARFMTFAYPLRNRTCRTPMLARNSARPSLVTLSVTTEQPGLSAASPTASRAMSLFPVRASYPGFPPGARATNPARSPSVSNIMPRSAPAASQAAKVFFTISGFSGLGMPLGKYWLGTVPMDPLVSAPISLSFSAKKAALPPPALTTTLIPSSGAMKFTSHSSSPLHLATSIIILFSREKM